MIKMNREAEKIIIDFHKLKSYVNHEINVIVEDLKDAKYYQKRYLEGSLSVFKKIQNKIRETLN